MAASLYATPPPDHLSGDETALSDVSETVPMSPAQTMKPLQRSLSVTSVLSTPEANANNESDTNSAAANERTSPFAGNESIAGASNESDDSPMDTEHAPNIPAGDGSNDQLSALLFDSMPDNSKKRRKQSMPFRISEILNSAASSASQSGRNLVKTEESNENESGRDQLLPRIFLSNLSQLQGKRSPSVKSDDLNENSNGPTENGSNKRMPTSAEELLRALANNLTCNQCGLRLDSEIQLGLHMLQEHGPTESTSLEDGIPKLFVKKESSMVQQQQQWNDEDKIKRALAQSNGAMKPEDWLASLSSLPFTFPPEAAMMLSASGYLPQMPLLGVANPFQAGDGMPRATAPPLRIFNPEAYCDLCNKEFCNKYFLKTHKANKHNIREPFNETGSSTGSLPAVASASSANSAENVATNQLSQLSQIFQMQQQQLAAAQQQLISPKSPTQSSSKCQSPSNGSQSDRSINAENSVLCTVCFKRFPNMVAMRRHRNKVHDMSAAAIDSVQSENAEAIDQQITMPDGFREDYQIEQEDTTFTPQPRKMSPQSIQLAREANFSVDKLKRLGVTDPEAFCEICCKEYCNKYFLRTHKIKRHGIFMPMDDAGVKDEHSMVNAAAAAAQAWQLMQSTPLNLIMNQQEALNQLHQQRKKFEAAALRKVSIDSQDDDQPEQLASKKRKTNDGGSKKLNKKDVDERQEKLVADAATNDGEHISVDLQKLQSMIMQLSDLNAHRPVACGLCGKELENQFALHSHMLSEHAGLMGDNNNGHKATPPTSPVRSQATAVEQCKHCDKELPNQFALSQHMFDVHGVTPTSPVREGFVTPERPVSGPVNLPPQAPAGTQQNERRTPYTITPTSSYCEICNKELCNKYFMKTHMQRMHGIEIENGAQIGGVVCNICNKELCSKYFLRVHKHNSHGIVDDGQPLPNAQRSNGDSSETTAEAAYRAETTPTIKPELSTELVSRYTAQFGDVCPLCSRRFRGAKWLRSHLLNDHGKAGADKLREIEQQLSIVPKSAAPSPTLKIPNGGFANANDPNFLQKQALTSLFSAGAVGSDEASMTPTSSVKAKEYQCTYCPFSSPSYAFLYIHKRSLHAAQFNAESLGTNEVGDMIGEAQRQHSLASDGQASNATTPRSTPATTPISLPLIGHDAKDTEIEALAKVAEVKQEFRARNTDEQRYAQNVLMEMANLTKRPTTYAIPQEIGAGMVMQSFLMQPIDEDYDYASSEADDSPSRSRFVPSVVFLPVKERVVGKTTISFSLTPA